jgi:parallel beta-helix repeat protein
MITWTYNAQPYLESAEQLKSDLILAYDCGAKYAIIYDSSDGYLNTTLTDDHFNTLKGFWAYTQNNPGKHGSVQADTALVLPQDFAFGLRNPTDSVWGYRQADDGWSQKMYSDVTTALYQYNLTLNIVYSDPEFQQAVQRNYGRIINWPADFERGTDYPVTDLANGLGYNTIQKALDSFATYDGDTLQVKAGNYAENLNITKTVTLVSENPGAALIDGSQNGTTITLAADGINLTDFTVVNGGRFSAEAGAGILLNNACNCTLKGDVIRDCYNGILLQDSSNNTLRDNVLTGNTFNFGVSGSSAMAYSNDVDESNTVNGKPICYWVGEANIAVPADAGYVALVNCTNLTVSNLQMSSNCEGLLLAYTHDTTVTNCTLNRNNEGMVLVSAYDNSLRNNDMNGNSYNFVIKNALPNDIDASNMVEGKSIIFWTNQHDLLVPLDAGYVALINCTEITVQNLHLSNNGQGILLAECSNCTVTGNEISNQISGIELCDASNITIAKNRISNSLSSGISATSSDSNTFTNNILVFNDEGFHLDGSSHNQFSENNVTSNDYGFWFDSSDLLNSTENAIFENTLSANNFGVDIEWGGENNTFWRNNFLNNSEQIYGIGMKYHTGWGGYAGYTLPKNSWDNGSIGNYWSDYSGIDADGNGVGDSPYSINGWNQDNYPQMQLIQF